MFPDEFKNEVQLLPTVISYDKENQPDILAITASSAALAISGMPFMGPVGASRVGFVDGKYILNPSKAELENSSLDLVVAGTKDAVLMVESEANGLSEEEMLNAVKFGHEGFVPVIQMIEELAKECRKPEWKVEKKDLSDVKKKLESTFTDDLKKAFAKAFLRSSVNVDSNFFFTSDKSFFSTFHSGFLHSFASSSIIWITGTNPSCPNLTAFNISSSDKPLASDSTISTASLVPATTKSKLEFSNSAFEGLRIYLPSTKPTLEAPTGPINGIPEIASAADEAVIAKISG